MRPPHFEVASIRLNVWEHGAHYSPHLMEKANEKTKTDYPYAGREWQVSF
jgi:hypothetical protein